ncbi:bifunctional GNAT family N-acetyltransferase/NUDIX hydrolase [Streptomyces sp. NBC_00046]|uniref:bifunctional GNAT family N-acetyltransferase/NUDIX hydrolase n=1 Tax=unclassified Streptomyces TaxID=2593676 RepID=UPI0032558CB7
MVRPAVPADAESIVRLRSAHVLSEPMNEEWILRCTEELAPRLAHTGDARAFVIDTGDGSIDACALGLIHPLLPTPAYPKGLAARVHVVATRPDVRRRGYARAVVSALLDHLRTEQITLFELHASEEAAPLYRELGFAGSPALMRMAATAAQPTVPDLRPEHVATKSSPKPEHYAETVAKATMWACLYFTDEDDQPLQVHSVYSPAYPWQLVGGTVDPGEHPWQTAVRECAEEIGITPAGQPRLLATVYSLPGGGWPYSTIGCVFDGGRLTAAQIRGIVLNPEEHDEVRVLPLTGWKELMPPGDFARLIAVEEARRTGVAAYIDSWEWGNS